MPMFEIKVEHTIQVEADTKEQAIEIAADTMEWEIQERFNQIITVAEKSNG
jgi:hypothetical protein